jgi:hypothetical protein
MCTKDESNSKLPNDVAAKMRTNAIKYERYKDRFDDIPIEELNEFRLEVELAFSRITSGGPVVAFVDYDPYKSLAELTVDIINRFEMKISSLNNDSKLLPGDLNLKFRAVHDFLHYFLQQPFNYLGEYKVYQAQKHIHKSQLRRQILYSEVVLQAAYCEYFGHFSDKQKIVL